MRHFAIIFREKADYKQFMIDAAFVVLKMVCKIRVKMKKHYG